MNFVPAVLALTLLVLMHSGCGATSPVNCRASVPTIDLTSLNSPLPESAFKAEISLPYGLPFLKAGRRELVNVLVRNNSNLLWPARGQLDGKYEIRLGDHWFDASGTTVLHDDDRRNLSYDLEPGQQAEFLIPVIPPKSSGAYTLELDLVQEQVIWFSQKGSKALTLKVNVE